jgi:hypothetical protein
VTAAEQINQLVVNYIPGAPTSVVNDLTKQYGRLFDEGGKLYDACAKAIYGVPNLRNPRGFVFAFLRGVDNAGGYDAWANGPTTRKRQRRPLDVEKVLGELRGLWANYVQRYSDDELRAEIAKTAHMGDGDFVLGTRASSLANRLHLARA